MSLEIKNDLFHIENGEAYRCYILEYTNGHSAMYVKAQNENEEFYVIFEYVYFFSGLMSWQGINFTVATDAECEELLGLTINEQIKVIDDKELVEAFKYKLYKIDNLTPKLVIVARKAHLVKDPEILRAMGLQNKS